MKIRVSATRMEMMKLKRRLALATRGHRLLKDKQDELVRQFFLWQAEYRSLLNGLWTAIDKSRFSLTCLRGSESVAALELACQSAGSPPHIESGKKRVLNLAVPTYRLAAIYPEPLHGLLACAGSLENVVIDYLALLPLLLRKAELERTIEIILVEIEVTKRRVNALEYKLIPSLIDSISSITAKLSELELANLTRLMRIKEIIEERTSVV